MYVRVISSIFCMKQTKGLSSLHLSSQEFQNSTIGYARIQYKGFSFWLVLLFSKEHGVGCFSFPKFFLPWYVCFWGNSSSLTLGMFDTMDCFCKTKGFKGAPQTKTWPVQQFLCNGWIKLSHLLSGTFTLSWFYQSLLNSQYNWMTDDITWHC